MNSLLQTIYLYYYSFYKKRYLKATITFIISSLYILYIGVLLHQDQPDIVRIERQMEIAERKEEYKWLPVETKTPDFPGCINAVKHDDIPLNSQFSDPSTRSFNTGRVNAVMNLGLGYLMTLVENWDSFDDFKKMISSKNIFTDIMPSSR